MRSSIIIVIIFLLAAIGAAFLVADKKDTEVIIINVTLARPPIDDETRIISPDDKNDTRIISHVDAATSFVKRMEIPEDTPVFMPGITVLVIQDQKEKSGWNSIEIPKGASIYGTYSLTVKLADTIDKSRPVGINTRVLGPTGTEISVKMTDVMVS